MNSTGFNNKIIIVDLNQGKISYDQPGADFYRTYVGGANIGAYYLLKGWEPGIDAFDPKNIITFTASPLTGTPVSGFSRHSVVSRSPLTGLIVDSEAGGYFGAELKKAGYDGVVIKGKSDRLVYLSIKDGKVELKDASNLKGLVTKEVEERIREELGDEKTVVTGIGPAGENLVRFACITNNLKHFNGRAGLGAVMGSKNLKAIAVRGNGEIKVKDKELLKEKVKSFASGYKDNLFNNLLHNYGTAGLINIQNIDGQLPTRNFKKGTFSEAENLSGEAIDSSIFHRAEACYACAVRCKMAVASQGEKIEIDPAYGGPEYESLAALGSYTEVGDLQYVAKANELCNKYGIDSISMGNITAFIMECYEKELISKEDTDGLELNFGNGEALLELIELVKDRQGIGGLLAEGINAASKKIGPEAEKLAVHVKGYDFPAHDPRAKVSFGLAYAVQPIGADHIGHFGDPGLSPTQFDTPPDNLNKFGFYSTQKPDSLDTKKAAFFYYGQMINSFHDVFDICTFTTEPGGFWKTEDLLELIKAITGWNYSFWELMKLGERRINMLKVFNILEGACRKDDRLPVRMFEAIETGPREGQAISEKELDKAIDSYYKVAGWNKEGIPESVKLYELGLGWLEDLLEKNIR